MKPKEYIKFIFVLLCCIQTAYGQQSDRNKKPKLYLSFESAGMAADGQIKESTNGHIFYVFTSGGFVNIHSTPYFKDLVNKIYFKAYFKSKDTANAHKEMEVAQKFNLDGPAVYLSPDSEFFIDMMDQKTKKLVYRYVIKRPKLSPEIKFYQQKSGKVFNSSILNGGSSELKLSPDENLTLRINERNDFKGMEVEYTLVNLKTKKSQYGVGKTEFNVLKFAANTDYELRVNYVVQKENSTITYIHVKPYWYQSSITYIILIIAIIAFGFLMLTLLLKNKIRSSQKEQQKMEQAAIRLQSLLNPHFTFNALSSIQGLMNTNRIDEANQYLQEFSSLLRKTLAKSQHVFNSLDQELEMMRIYIKLEAFRFNFSWTIEVAEELNPSVIEIPTLLIQPLIENSIKHGLSGLGDKGQLSIICKEGEKKDTFVIVVKDNGKWLDEKVVHGYGLSLTAERIATINKMKKEQSIDLHFNKQTGTAAILTFHNWIY